MNGGSTKGNIGWFCFRKETFALLCFRLARVVWRKAELYVRELYI